MIHVRTNKLWIKDDILMPVQVEPITQTAQTTRSQAAARGESWGLKTEFQDWVCEHAWPIIIEQEYTWWKLNSLWQEAAVLECCCPLDLWPLWIWQAGGVSEASGGIFYPWLDSRNSPARAWCTGGLRHGDILFVFLSIPPSLAVAEIKTIPSDVSPAIWGGSQSFTSGVVKDTVCSLWSLIRIQTDGILLLSRVFFLLTLSFIRLLEGAGHKVLAQVHRTKKTTICF